MPFLSNIGSTELLIIGIILLVLFGGKKLSELARGLGQSGKELRNAKNELTQALNGTASDIQQENPPPPPVSENEEKTEEVKKARKVKKGKKGKGGGVTNV